MHQLWSEVLGRQGGIRATLESPVHLSQTHFRKQIIRKHPGLCWVSPRPLYSPHQPKALPFLPHRPQPLASFSSFQSIHSLQLFSSLLFFLSWCESDCCLLTLPASGTAWTPLHHVHPEYRQTLGLLYPVLGRVLAEATK